MTQHSAQFATDYQNSLPVHVLRTRDRDGERCYFVVRSSAQQMSRLKAKKGTGKVNVADYGEVLASGYGDAPNAAVCGMLNNRYGIELSPQEKE